MKMITAIVRPFKLEPVRAALTELGVEGMTITEIKGIGRQKGQTEIYRGSEYMVEFQPKIKLEIVAMDDRVERIIDTIQSSAKTEKIGDGKIFVSPMMDAVRIRTGEHGDAVL